VQESEAEVAARDALQRCAAAVAELASVRAALAASEEAVKTLTWQVKMSADPAPSPADTTWLTSLMGCRPTLRR